MQQRFKKRYVPAKRAPGPKKARGVGYATMRVKPSQIKFFDSAFPQTSIPAGPASLIDATLVAEIINGTGPRDRIGRKIKVVKIDYSLTVILSDATVGNNTEAIRYDIWLDKQCNGFAPAPTDLYTALATATGTCQMPNLFNEKRFKRLYTHTVQMNTLNANTAPAALRPCSVGHKFEGSLRPNIVIEFDATTGNIADLTSNNIFQCWSTDNGVGITQNCFTRVHYTDV